MRWRMPVFFSTVGLIVLAWASPALAKGPDQATINGPGLARPIVITGFGEPGSVGNLGELADGSGLFLAMFGPDGENQLVSATPAGTLGPRYDLTYRVPDGTPNGGLVRQDLYPEAAVGPVTFTAAGQAVFGTVTSGGWYRGPATFGVLLSTIGLPAGANASAASKPSAVASAAAQSATSPSHETPWLPIALASLAVIVAAAGGSLWLLRRRTVAHRHT
jgi:hypothetical protein